MCCIIQNMYLLYHTEHVFTASYRTCIYCIIQNMYLLYHTVVHCTLQVGIPYRCTLYSVQVGIMQDVVYTVQCTGRYIGYHTGVHCTLYRYLLYHTGVQVYTVQVCAVS